MQNWQKPEMLQAEIKNTEHKLPETTEKDKEYDNSLAPSKVK